jgi:hypothetical protein
MTTFDDRFSGQEAQEISTWLEHREPRDIGTIKRAASGNEDQATGAVSGTDGSSVPALGVLSRFESWSAVASTMLHKAETLSGWNPESVELHEAAWELYLSKVSTLPFFTSTNSRQRDVSISATSLKPIIDALDAMTSASAVRDVFAAIVESVKKVATVAVENRQAEDKRSYLAQGVLSIRDSQLHVAYFVAPALMTYRAGKGYDPATQVLSIRGFSGVLDFGKCQRHAAMLLGWTGITAEEWCRRTTSAAAEPNGSPAWDV